VNGRLNSRTIAIIAGVIIVVLAGIALANPGLLNLSGAAGGTPGKPEDTPVPPAVSTDTPVPPAAPTDTQAPAEPTNTQESAAPTNTQESAAPTNTQESAAPTATSEKKQKITLCHATGSETNPYVEITISYNGLHGHEDHAGDIIPAPAGGCPAGSSPTNTPKPTQDNGNKKITLCHATGSATNPYVEITISYNGLHGHEDHAGDIIPAPAGGCPAGSSPTNTPPADNSTATPQPKKITICHATGSAKNPYVEITISYNGLHGHEDHVGDIIPAPAGGCPKPTEDNTPKKITLCHATGSAKNPYVEITISYNGLHGHEDHAGDIIPMPAGGCPKAPNDTATPNPKKITLCHATGSATNPYVEITISYNGLHGHEDHAGDIIPMPAGGCPKGNTSTPRPSNTPVPTNTATPRPTNTATPGPSLTPTPGPSMTPSNTPTSAPTATPTATIPPPPPELDIQPAPAVAASCPQRLVFHTFRDNNLEIYRLDGVEGVPGAQLFNLSNSTAVDSRPSRSPNDQWVVFESNRTGNVELYYTDIKGQTQARLTNTNANNINAMFGPDNETVIFQSDRNGNWDIFSINITTGVERQLTTDSHDDIHPYWSPDPNWIVFESDRTGSSNLFLLNLSTGNEFQVTRDVVEDIFPAWSPNGKQLAFLSNVQGFWSLFVVDATGKNLMQVTKAGDAGNVSWSPEGNRLAYQVENSGNVDVFTYDLRNNTEYHLTDYAGPDSAPSWDCGGTKIAFTSTRDGDPNLLQVNWQGGSQTNITVNPATDKWSEWSPSKETGSRGH